MKEPERINPILENGRIDVALVPAIVRRLDVQPARGFWVHKVREGEFLAKTYKPGTCLACLLGTLAGNNLSMDGLDSQELSPSKMADYAMLKRDYAMGLSDGWEDDDTFSSAITNRHVYDLGVQDGWDAFRLCLDTGLITPTEFLPAHPVD